MPLLQHFQIRKTKKKKKTKNIHQSNIRFGYNTRYTLYELKCVSPEESNISSNIKNDKNDFIVGINAI